MTQLLETAFTEASKLPPAQQDNIAQQILAELAAENQWQQRFDDSQDILTALAAEALSEHQAGQTKDIDFQK